MNEEKMLSKKSIKINCMSSSSINYMNGVISPTGSGAAYRYAQIPNHKKVNMKVDNNF